MTSKKLLAGEFGDPVMNNGLFERMARRETFFQELPIYDSANLEHWHVAR